MAGTYNPSTGFVALLTVNSVGEYDEDEMLRDAKALIKNAWPQAIVENVFDDVQNGLSVTINTFNVGNRGWRKTLGRLFDHLDIEKGPLGTDPKSLRELSQIKDKWGVAEAKEEVEQEETNQGSYGGYILANSGNKRKRF